MDNLEYPSNSNSGRDNKDSKISAEAKKIEKVVTGTAKTKKKSGLQKFTGAMISEDAGDVKSYILTDVLIPACKKAISDAITIGIDILLYGESRPAGKKRSIGERVSYNKYYGDRDRERRERPSSRRATYEYDDIVLDTRAEVEAVLDRLEEQLDEYGSVSVGDLYDAVGITGTFTDYKYGWLDLRTARSERVRDGYWIKLPKAVPLD